MGTSNAAYLTSEIANDKGAQDKAPHT